MNKPVENICVTHLEESVPSGYISTLVLLILALAMHRRDGNKEYQLFLWDNAWKFILLP